ncbi:MAG: hypothetical protein M3Q71_09110 [Chloroflexota bacterium]|nr:hypothetical protein [Chloroflexota bacterium]MDP9470816.1 hypothetical protein [Chloroflexota bacterium]
MSPMTRRDALKLAAGAAVALAPLPLAASVSAAPALPVPTDPPAPAVMTVDDIMALYRRMFVLHAPVDRDDGTTTWANDDAIFTLDRARDEVVVSGLDGPEWMVGAKAGTVPLVTWCVGRPPLTAAYALLFLTAEGERRVGQQERSERIAAAPDSLPAQGGFLTIANPGGTCALAGGPGPARVAD